jgi:hypothetical protein
VTVSVILPDPDGKGGLTVEDADYLVLH